jgi:hypothetical protein
VHAALSTRELAGYRARKRRKHGRAEGQSKRAALCARSSITRASESCHSTLESACKRHLVPPARGWLRQKREPIVVAFTVSPEKRSGAARRTGARASEQPVERSSATSVRKQRAVLDRVSAPQSNAVRWRACAASVRSRDRTRIGIKHIEQQQQLFVSAQPVRVRARGGGPRDLLHRHERLPRPGPAAKTGPAELAISTALLSQLPLRLVYQRHPARALDAMSLQRAQRAARGCLRGRL